MKTTLAWAIACIFLATAGTAALASPKTNQISIRYLPPDNPAHEQIYQIMKERRVLERLQEFLSPFRLPRTLQISTSGCDGEADAFYGDDEITICYEYVEALMKNMPAETTPSGVEPWDTVAGPFFDTSLHEFAHALFDIHNVPVLGRIEDAADQVGAYIYLQLGPEEARRLFRGTAWTYLAESRAEDPPSLVEFADEHGLPAQRAYNLLCMAYGADTEIFGGIVSEGYLPEDRAEFCEEEYEQVQDACEILFGPHIDQELASDIFDRTWLWDEQASATAVSQ